MDWHGSEEIKELKAEIARLRAALEEIANSTWVAQTCPEAAQIALKALANKEGPENIG